MPARQSGSQQPINPHERPSKMHCTLQQLFCARADLHTQASWRQLAPRGAQFLAPGGRAARAPRPPAVWETDDVVCREGLC